MNGLSSEENVIDIKNILPRNTKNRVNELKTDNRKERYTFSNHLLIYCKLLQNSVPTKELTH